MSDTEQAAAPPEKKKNRLDEMLKYRLSQVILAHVNKLDDGSLVLQDDWSDEKTLEHFPNEKMTIHNVKHQRERLRVKPKPPIAQSIVSNDQRLLQTDVAWLKDAIKEIEKWAQEVGSTQADHTTSIGAIEAKLAQHLDPWIKAKKVNSTLEEDVKKTALKSMGDRINEMNETFDSKMKLLEKRVAALEPAKKIAKEKEMTW